MEQDWSEDDVLWFGKEDLQRWGKEALQLWGKEELLRYDEMQKLEHEIDELHVKQEETAQLLREKNQRWDALATYSATPPHTEETTPMDRRDSGISMESLPTPSFMRHTISSKSKTLTTPLSGLAGASSNSAHPLHNPCRFYDIIRDTHASRLKKLPAHGLTYLARGQGHPSQQDPEDCEAWILEPANVVPDPTPERPECEECKSRAAARTAAACAECKAHVANFDIPFCIKCYELEAAQPALIAKTRLLNPKFNESPEPKGPIPFHIQMDFKQRSEFIAKKALWLAEYEHHPRFLQRSRFCEGPEAIRFGSADLWADGFGSLQYPNECNELCGRDRYSVFWAITNMIPLRNSIAHCVDSTPEQLITLMSLAMQVAVKVGNEELAMEVDGMREEVHELAKLSGAEIVRNHALILEGKDVKWKIHHQKFFLNGFADNDLPEAISQAAKYWRKDHDVVGYDENFVARVEKAKSWIYWKHVGGKDEDMSSYADVMVGGEGEPSPPLIEEVAAEKDGCSTEASETDGRPMIQGEQQDLPAISLIDWEAEEAKRFSQTSWSIQLWRN